MSQLRIDPITNEKVLMAADRSHRPSDLKLKDTEPESGENCPFCPGHESQTPPRVDILPGQEGWLTRTFPNKFPILEESHYVVVESPEHNKNYFNMNQQEIINLLKAYQRAYRLLSQKDGLEYILVFKNYQKEAGASLHHPHAQVIGSDFIPTRVELELDNYQKYYEKMGECIFCKMMEDEIGGPREIRCSDSYLVLAPYASRFSYETWILPRNHQVSFTEMSQRDLEELARILLEHFKRLNKILGDFPFNLYIHNGSLDANQESDFHWHIEITPRLNKMAGFELGGGVMVNTVLPEQVADILRQEVL